MKPQELNMSDQDIEFIDFEKLLAEGVVGEFDSEKFAKKMKIYLEGTHAFLYNTHSLNQNPHVDETDREEWHNGWIDAKHAEENESRHFYIQDEENILND